MAERWGVPVGLSDNTLGTVTATTAVALGVCMIEKHLTLRRSDGGPDAAFSLETAEFASMVSTVRECEAALGGVRYGPSDRERSSLAFRRSLFVVENMVAGEVFTERNVRVIRPADGLAPRHLPSILGKHATCAITRGTPLDWALISE